MLSKASNDNILTCLKVLLASSALCLLAVSAGFGDVSNLPGFEGASGWMGDGPVKINDLKNRIVVVDFYTSRCSNCLAAIPHVVKLYEKYKKDGLIVIGVHTPETDSERSISVVKSTAKRLGYQNSGTFIIYPSRQRVGPL